MLHFSGQHQRSLSDVEEDATVPEGVEHGMWNINNPCFTPFIFVLIFIYFFYSFPNKIAKKMII